MKNSYRFFQNKECEYFPCHRCGDPENFNCLFCYCPLYVLGKNCGGAFEYLENGTKDCSRCLLPHRPEEYDTVIARFGEIKASVERLESAKAARPNPGTTAEAENR